MAFYGEADLIGALNDTGVDVSIADQWYTKGYFDVADEVLLIENNLAAMSGRVFVLVVMAGTLGPSCKEGTSVTVDSVLYTIHSVLSQADGAQQRIVLLRRV
jgi:hypothetical protein